MAGLADFCGDIVAGYDQCGNPVTTPGIEASLYVGNKKDFTFTFDADNPLIITAITAVGSAVLYKVKGTGDTFNAISKKVTKAVGGRFSEAVNYYITDNSSETKKFVVNASNGRQFYIAVNNSKETDGAIDMYGCVNGLQLSENSQRDAADEDMQGGWKLEAINPPKLLEPYPPRSVFIPGVSGPATYATTIAALDALLT